MIDNIYKDEVSTYLFYNLLYYRRYHYAYLLVTYLTKSIKIDFNYKVGWFDILRLLFYEATRDDDYNTLVGYPINILELKTLQKIVLKNVNIENVLNNRDLYDGCNFTYIREKLKEYGIKN